MSLREARLMDELKTWRKEKPFGFIAKPVVDDGKKNISRWRCAIPGKDGTLWEGGLYWLDMIFPEDYPTKPPKCVFTPVLFHPNVYPSGTVCLNIINEEEGWRPAITAKEILLGIQWLLSEVNMDSPAQSEAYNLMKKDPSAYEKRVRKSIKESHPLP